MYISMYVCMYVCMYIYILLYIHMLFYLVRLNVPAPKFIPFWRRRDVRLCRSHRWDDAPSNLGFPSGTGLDD